MKQTTYLSWSGYDIDQKAASSGRHLLLSRTMTCHRWLTLFISSSFTLLLCFKRFVLLLRRRGAQTLAPNAGRLSTAARMRAVGRHGNRRLGDPKNTVSVSPWRWQQLRLNNNIGHSQSFNLTLSRWTPGEFPNRNSSMPQQRQIYT